MNKDLDFTVTKIFALIERKAASDWAIKDIPHGNSQRLTLILSGKGEFEYNQTVHKMEKNELIWFPHNVQRSGRVDPSDPWHFIGLHFNLEIYGENAENDFSHLKDKVMHCPKYICQKIMDLSATWQEKGMVYQTKCRAMLQDILTDLIIYNEKNKHNPLLYQKIETIQTYIQENIKKPFQIQELAAMAGISVSYFRQIFKSISGMSVTQYINFIKINKAKDLLITGEYNVTEVAHQTGFTDIFYFSRIFKQHTGHSPSYYLH